MDEIGDMTLATQAKILRVLQEGCFERLGGEETIPVDVRIIVATNRNLENAIEEKKFREDLYYRIKVVTITLPPLRMREQDIPDLVDYFLEKHCNFLHMKKISLSSEVLGILYHYHWPGNIRELENLIRRAIVLCKGNVITPELLIGELAETPKDEKTSIPVEKSNFMDTERIQKFKGQLYEKVMSETEKTLILQTLKETKGNQVQAAKLLGISRVMLRNKIGKYGIKSEFYIEKG